MPTIRAPSVEEHRQVVRRGIIQAFTDALRVKPFASITVGEVALRVGVARSSIYRYFRDREDLLLTYLTEVSQRQLVVAARYGTSEVSGIVWLRTALQVALDAHIDPAIRSARDGVGGLPEPGRRQVRELDLAFVELLEEIVTRGRIDGSVAVLGDPATTARVLAACIVGVRDLVTSAKDADELTAFMGRALGTHPTTESVRHPRPRSEPLNRPHD